ncbi:hypothetical protein ACJH6H_03685 [Mycobacterium sp. SMC-21]|uniref:hypothetical protein n=1 Tax=unclassified Mycobacterium TaxID=2642494 RepID=UPI0038761F68
MTSVAAQAAEEAHSKDRLVPVLFNNQSIQLPRGPRTGAQIKADAIRAGVVIQQDFPLAVKQGNRYVNIGDADVVNVHPNMEFTAVAGDDNS